MPPNLDFNLLQTPFTKRNHNFGVLFEPIQFLVTRSKVDIHSSMDIFCVIQLGLHTKWAVCLILLMLNPDIPCFYKQKPTDLDLNCLSLSMWIYSNNLDQAVWLAEN